jgi:hypothetical protein
MDSGIIDAQQCPPVPHMDAPWQPQVPGVQGAFSGR